MRLVALAHALAVLLPAGWQATYHRFTPCSDPVERVSLVGRGAQIMLQERLHPVAAELRTRRPQRFSVQGPPAPIECCSLDRKGWTIEFAAAGRAFYAFLYPSRLVGRTQLLRILDSLRVRKP